MNARGAMAQYRSVQSQGAVTDARPTRLIQLAYEHLLGQLAVARGCMERMDGRRELADVIGKGRAVARVNAILGELSASLDLERGQDIAGNLLALYSYMMTRMTDANLHDDVRIVDEVSSLVREIKSGWDQLVETGA